jgi:two-component system, chemotaxis family, sensor kinase CheA
MSLGAAPERCAGETLARLAVDDLVQEFLVESNENLDRVDTELVKLESDPGSVELLASIFRGVHSIKGACGFLGFNKLQALAHAGENLLSKLRDGALVLTPEISSALLATVDGIRQMLATIASTEQDGEETYTEVIETLQRLASAQPLQASPSTSSPAPAQTIPAPAATPNTAPPASAAVSTAPANAVPADPATPKVAPSSPPANPVPEKKSKFQPQPGKLGGVLVERKRITADALVRALEAQQAGDARPIGEILVSAGAVTAAEVAEALRALDEARNQSAQDSTIRVNVTLLDRLMNLVGELVLARNQIVQYASQQEDNAFLATIQQLNLVTSELREGVMKTRMQPISRLFDKVPRVVRDVSVACGKQVRIDAEGKNTELDRTLLEAINDPLTHLVRNAIDHGIELPARRVELGKPAEGLLTLRALHEGGQVTIEISDDGAGIDAERIRRKALERGAITAEQAARMSAAESLNLIFLPGVSTAEKVTNVSGRGVGMDVVKTNIERVGGSVEIQTRLGEGSTFKVKVPLTLAIVPALIVRSAGKCFAIPQVNLVELVRLENGHAGIEMVHGASVYRLRGRLLPLVHLNRELKLAPVESPGDANCAALNIVVLQVDSRRFGLVVDEVHDAEEIVVKPLSKHLKGIRAYAGATIMGDGKLALILDVLGIAAGAGITADAHEALVKKESSEAQVSAGDAQKFILFSGPGNSRMALPLNALARLEEIPVSRIELSGERSVVQYRGQILPLIRVSKVLPTSSNWNDEANVANPASTVSVLVLNHDGRTFGLVVDRIVDIVEQATEVRAAATRDGVLCSTVIGEHVTELLDVPAIWRMVAPSSNAASGAAAGQD